MKEEMASSYRPAPNPQNETCINNLKKSFFEIIDARLNIQKASINKAFFGKGGGIRHKSEQ